MFSQQCIGSCTVGNILGGSPPNKTTVVTNSLWSVTNLSVLHYLRSSSLASGSSHLVEKQPTNSSGRLQCPQQACTSCRQMQPPHGLHAVHGTTTHAQRGAAAAVDSVGPQSPLSNQAVLAPNRAGQEPANSKETDPSEQPGAQAGTAAFAHTGTAQKPAAAGVQHTQQAPHPPSQPSPQAAAPPQRHAGTSSNQARQQRPPNQCRRPLPHRHCSCLPSPPHRHHLAVAHLGLAV